MQQEQSMGRSAWITLGIMSGMGLVTLFGETIVSPALPKLVDEFQISLETSLWILSAFLISGAVMTPISGKLSDSYGKKRVLLVVIGIYCVGVVAASTATNVIWMVAARVLMGVGFSAFPVAFGIIRETLPMSKLGIGQTVFGSTFSGGAVLGLALGGGIIHAFGWRIAFLSVFPIALLLLILIVLFVKESKVTQSPEGQMHQGHQRTTLDLKGVVLLATAVVSFLVGISLVQNSVSDPSAYTQIAGLLTLAAISLVLLVVVERRSKFPLVDFKLLSGRTTLAATVILMFVGTCTFIVYQTMAFLVQSPTPLGFGGDELTTAIILLPFMVVLFIGTIGSGFILNRLGNIRMTAIGTSLATVGFFGLLFYHANGLEVMLMLATISAGLSFAFTGGFNVVLVTSPTESTGTVLGMVLLLNLVFQSIGPAVSATFQQLYQGSVPGDPKTYPAPEAYYLIFLTAAALSLVSALLSIWLSRRKLPSSMMPGQGQQQAPPSP